MIAGNARDWFRRRDRTATLDVFAVDWSALPVTSRPARDMLSEVDAPGSGFVVRHSDYSTNGRYWTEEFDQDDGGLLGCEGTTMISTWSEWKRYPRAGRGENIEAPISPGIFEVRFAGTGALHSFDAVDNVAQALALLPVGSKSWFGRRGPAIMPDLEYRTCATSSRADAKAAAERMIGRRETYMSGAA
jgi:hypothetical protein